MALPGMMLEVAAPATLLTPPAAPKVHELLGLQICRCSARLAERLQGASCRSARGAFLPHAPGENPHLPLQLRRRRRTWFTALWQAEV